MSSFENSWRVKMKLSRVNVVLPIHAMYSQVDQEDTLAIVAGQHLVLVQDRTVRIS